jgi:hypothetical protein
MLKSRSVSGTDGTVWESVKERDGAQQSNGSAPEQVHVTFSGGIREVEVALPHGWSDVSAWPDWVILGEIEKTLKG